MIVDMLSWVDFQQMQIRKLMPLPHHIASTTVHCCVCICVVISGWYVLLCLFFPSCHGTCILSCCTQRWCRTVFLCFICVHPLSHNALWLPHPWLALSCSALPPICFPFIDSVPVSPFPSPLSSLQHSSDIFLSCWSRSDRGRGERRGGWQECQILSCADTLGLSLSTPLLFFFAFAASSVQHCGGLW